MCLCDKDNEYMCLECETFLNQEVRDLAIKYKDQILKDKDWWYGLTNWSINIFQNESNPNQLEVNAYRVGTNGMDDYSASYYLEPLEISA